MDTDDVRASGETEQRFVEPWIDPVEQPRLSAAEVGLGEGAVEVTEQEVESEPWMDGGTTDTTSSWYKRLLNWMRRTTQTPS